MQFKDLVSENKKDWLKVVKHPFVDEIYRGKLAEETFKFYLIQDHYYLNQSMRNMAILISKAENLKQKQQLIDILNIEANVEFAKYQELLEYYSLEVKSAEEMKMTYSNIAYSNYLLAVSSQAGFAEGMAALIPCYWIYLKMAEYHHHKLKENDNQIYQDWATVFKSSDYKELVENMVEILEKEIETKNFKKLNYHFKNSIKFEYQFFSDVYQRKIWEI
ncbi:TenA family protein [Halanaerobium hydrogeniformans]|uniref:Aminopyrimidine aminohydrolase n=1 Tax=Halanaerobium hydrogeniformans TaxID=656519 RepID=E4RMV2_HALHG|nr:TenA family protein [Halanaerobium hydrogeniformans]ADQ14169.1 transcriptional activator, TenA family [Halanaerobium hydrogeniformans]